MFQKMYDRVLLWSKHRHAEKYLAALSFAESSFFPVPPDVMLVPMALADNQKAWRLALLTTLMSVAGGMLGYAIGFFLFDSIAGWLQQSRYWESYLLAEAWFNRWGVWAVFIAGFSPIPYKVFTIAAGVLQMMFIPFVLASAVGRGARFFLLALLIKAGGDKLQQGLRDYMDRLGWVVVILVIVGVGVYYYAKN